MYLGNLYIIAFADGAIAQNAARQQRTLSAHADDHDVLYAHFALASFSIAPKGHTFMHSPQPLH